MNLQKTGWILVSLLVASFRSYGQAPFQCDGDFFLSLTPSGQGTVSTMYRVEVDPTNTVSFSILPSSPASDVINAMGYRVTDNFIYGVNPQTEALYRIDSNGVNTFLTFVLGINPSYSYVAGDVTPDGNYLVILGATGGDDRDLVKIDLNSPTYNTSIISLTTASSGGTSSPTFRTADISFDPITGIIYGFDGQSERVITIDINTGVIDDQTFPTNAGADLLGAMFFDAFGNLYGYGRPNGGNLQNTLFSVSKTTGIITVITSGPNANGNDGCSCPYTIEMQKYVQPMDTIPCSKVVYTFKIANSSGTAQSGIDFQDVLPSGLTVGAILSNPYGGTINGLGTNTLSITNMNIPLGIDSMLVEVIVDTLVLGILENQAILTNLPVALGEYTLSDDPFTIITDDSTSLEINPVIVDLPNRLDSICSGDTLVLDASIYEGILYQWNDGSTQPTLDITQGGMYWVISSGCEIVYDTITVIEHNLPNVIASPDTVICLNDQVMISATGAQNHQWLPTNGLSSSIISNPFASPLDTTQYYVIGTDIHGCQNIDSLNLDVKPLPLVDAGLDQAICYYDTAILGNGNLPPGNYNWTPTLYLSQANSIQPVFTPINPGQYIYSLTATGPEGCINIDSVEVTVNDIEANYPISDISCFGANDGTSSIHMNAGAAPYSYAWYQGGGTPTFTASNSTGIIQQTGLGPGQYIALVTDSNGCIDDSIFTIVEPSLLTAMNTAQTNVDCFGGATGSVTILGSGGIMPYLYSIDGVNFSPNNTFSNLSALLYTVTVRDSNDCETPINVTIMTPTGLYGSIISQKNVDCFGNGSGAIKLQGNGGTAPYSYSLDGINFNPSNTLLGLFVGNDTAWIRDVNNCLVSVPFNISEPTLLTGSISSQKNVDCNGNATGEVEIGTLGGVLPYQFSIDGINFSPDSIFSSLNVGNYTVTIRDDSLCDIQLPITITEPPILTLSNIQQIDVDCFGNQTGEVSVMANGGTLPYEFALDSLPFGINNTFSNLGQGSYLITVRDDSSCTTELLVEITEPPLLEIEISQAIDISCFGDSTGWLELVGNGGTAPYHFALNNGLSTPSNLFNNLTAGIYSITITDDSNCVATISDTLTESPLLTLDLVSQKNVDCFGNATGEIEVEAGGGVIPYQFNLDNSSFSSNNSFLNLVAGSYTIEVRDDSNCTNNLNIIITEPEPLALIPSQTDILCFGESNGTASVDIQGGTIPYDIFWNTLPPQNTSMAMGLPFGTYSVAITDSQGCEISTDISIDQPELLELEMVSGSIVEAFCNWPNGSAEIIAIGGTEPYNYHWNSNPSQQSAQGVNLYGDIYSPYIIDANGCSDTIDVFINNVPPAIPAFSTNPSHQDSILLSQANISFNNLSEGATSWQWDFGDGFGKSSDPNPSYTYQEPGQYIVKLTVDNEYFACPTDTFLTLHIIPDGVLYFPNAFSPNGDGVNDLFFIKGEGIVDYELTIFDRWGSQITRYLSPDLGWDGTKNAKAIQEGTYVFVVRATFNNGTRIERSGSVVLIR